MVVLGVLGGRGLVGWFCAGCFLACRPCFGGVRTILVFTAHMKIVFHSMIMSGCCFTP